MEMGTATPSPHFSAHFALARSPVSAIAELLLIFGYALFCCIIIRHYCGIRVLETIGHYLFIEKSSFLSMYDDMFVFFVIYG